MRIAVCFLLAAGAFAGETTQGALRRIDRQGRVLGDCPLQHTSVKAEISGMLARVNVVQRFRNPFTESIEATYVFPLPHDAAVDRMTMIIGERRIQGKIKRRAEARALYEAARDSGRAASLLEQERPNLFTQSVANIAPGGAVEISISYVETLAYEDGGYEFVFPMAAGPRYIPKSVRDANRISPPVMPEGTRAAHDVSIEVTLDAGLPVGDIASKTHEIDVQRLTPASALVRLHNEAAIPNKDFILRYDTAGRAIESAALTHRGEKGGFFTLILQPPERTGAADVAPKELVFVLDTSGSMSGFPIEKAKETMKLALDNLYPQDTFNLITFSGDTEILFPEPAPATQANLRMARLFLESRAGGGGTEMMTAIRAALEGSGQNGRVRIVCFMTDGYVGNEAEILAEVEKHPAARVFAFGIGNATNRFLLDGMARLGRGDVEYVGLQDDGSAAARRFHQRVREPLLTDLSIDWGGLPVADVYPKRLPDLFSAKPVVLTGRYNAPARGVVRLRGMNGGREIVREASLDLKAADPAHDALAALWARRRIAELTDENQIAQLGVDFGVSTPFTSFVAVEETTVVQNGRPRLVEVPVNLPEGVQRMWCEEDVSYSISASHPGLTPHEQMGLTSKADRFTRTDGASLGSGGGVRLNQFERLEQFARVQRPSAGVPIDDVWWRNPDAKLDPSLLALTKTPNQQKTAVEVQILLRDASPATLEQLTKAGLEILRAPGPDLQVRGRITVALLRKLLDLPAVRYVVSAS